MCEKVENTLFLASFLDIKLITVSNKSVIDVSLLWD